MNGVNSHLMERARGAPLFILSFRHRDDLAATASRLGWRVIAARRADSAVQRFIASVAMIAVVDLRGAAEEGLAAVTALSDAIEVNGAALLVIGPRDSGDILGSALARGATHVLAGSFNEERFVLALRSAERHALRLLAFADPSHLRSDIWRDDQLTWEEREGRIVLSPALAARLKIETTSLPLDRYIAALPRAAQSTLRDAIALVRADRRPRAVTHQLVMGDDQLIIHHLRVDAASGALEGMIELPLGLVDRDTPRLKDPLTGLATLAAARQWLTRHAHIEQTMFLIGLPQFNMINSAFGRLTGDAVLRMLGRRIERLVTNFLEGDRIVARATGTSFFVAGTIPAERRAVLVAEFNAAVERPVIAEGHEVKLSAIVVSGETHPGVSPQEALRRLNAQVAQADVISQSTIEPHTQGRVDGDTETMLAIDLRAALDRGEIDILFQPQVAISTGKIVGVEALARWRHPAHGTLGATTLFAVAAQSNYLGVLSAHVQRRAVEVAATWPEHLNGLRLSVNVTAQDIVRPGFAPTFFRMLDDLGFPRARVTAEITEDGLIADLAAAAELLALLRDGGCRVAIDDFGTGYSSLAYLKALPLDYLKIDKSIAQDIVGTARDRIVVSSIIDMARSLGLAVIAEGVETEAQRAALAAQGCNYYQGFLCSEAVDTATLEKLITST